MFAKNSIITTDYIYIYKSLYYLYIIHSLSPCIPHHIRQPNKIKRIKDMSAFTSQM